MELNSRRIHIDYSVADRAHAPTPREYMGHRRSGRDSYRGSYGGHERDHDRDNHYRDRDRDRERYRDCSPRRYDRDHRDRDLDRGWCKPSPMTVSNLSASTTGLASQRTYRGLLVGGPKPRQNISPSHTLPAHPPSLPRVHSPPSILINRLHSPIPPTPTCQYLH